MLSSPGGYFSLIKKEQSFILLRRSGSNLYRGNFQVMGIGVTIGNNVFGLSQERVYQYPRVKIFISLPATRISVFLIVSGLKAKELRMSIVFAKMISSLLCHLKKLQPILMIIGGIVY